MTKRLPVCEKPFRTHTTTEVWMKGIRGSGWGRLIKAHTTMSLINPSSPSSKVNRTFPNPPHLSPGCLLSSVPAVHMQHYQGLRSALFIWSLGLHKSSTQWEPNLATPQLPCSLTLAVTWQPGLCEPWNKLIRSTSTTDATQWLYVRNDPLYIFLFEQLVEVEVCLEVPDMFVDSYMLMVSSVYFSSEEGAGMPAFDIFP